MKEPSKHPALIGLEWVLDTEGWSRKDGAWAGSVASLLGRSEWANNTSRAETQAQALALYPDILKPSAHDPWGLSATREGWIEIARRTVGIEAVTEWLLQQE